MNDNKPRISSPKYALNDANDHRVAVWKSRLFGWCVDRTRPYVYQTFPTHAEAIAYAQKIARGS